MPDAAPALGFDPSILGPEQSLMSGLGTRAQSLPVIGPDKVEAARRQAMDPKHPSLEPLDALQIQVANAEQERARIQGDYEQTMAQAKTKLQSAQAANEAAQSNKLMRDFEASNPTAPELHPTKENVATIASLFSLIGMIGTAMGHTGRNSAMNSLKAMTGMMEGWQKGDQARWERELKEFDKETISYKEKLDAALRKYEMGFKQLTNNREIAKAEMDMALAELGSPVAKAMRDKQGYETTLKLLQGLQKDVQHVATESGLERRQAQRENFDTHLEDIKHEHRLTENAAKAAEKGAGGKGGYASVLLAGRAENIREAYVQAAQDVLNVTQFPATTVLGTFAGMNGQSGDTLHASLANTFARKVTKTETRMLQQVISGLESNLAMALGGGYAASATKARMDQYKTQIPKEGDDGYVAANFLARLRQELDILGDNFPTKPGATPQMNEAVQASRTKIDKAIPFTVEDVVQAHAKHAGPPKATSDTPKATLNGRTIVVDPSGSYWVYEDTGERAQ